ncbi:2-2-dialkylglycine decarboxylase [Penicillium manginii]|jgi:4-aminobutyrate aminotransferase-like enzyme|uniref:2-2-dialkylglycine decarboxylase n=1 Tax=Penicillium manginii TaxID=203109 RepID=UPI0025467FA4|nr:2-2-dialkylglycine decarboxylase [Penicillium manginii]KAJ5754548.1 2-2-dialkylglycine decarboxylase [Penicillium manginii]
MSDYDIATATSHLLYTGITISPVKIVNARGTYIIDSDGRQILDFTSGQRSSLLGHSHPEIVEVVKNQIETVDHLHSTMITKPVADLVMRLARLVPSPLEKTLLLNTGSESVEAAIRLAKAYTGKFEVIALTASYHGQTSSASSATFSKYRNTGLPCMPGQLAFPAPFAYGSPFQRNGTYCWETEFDYGWSMIDRQTVGSLAAFIIEPILSGGGILELPSGYLRRLSAECKQRGIVLIVDEAQTGVGRAGKMFAFQEEEDFVPDILLLSKTLGCGVPLAALVTSAEIEKGSRQSVFYWNTTHQNDPLTAAVGNKTLEIVERDGLCQNSAERGAQLMQGLLRLKEKYSDWIGDTRGRGLLQGFELVSKPGAKMTSKELGAAVVEKTFAGGLSCSVVPSPTQGSVVRLVPPITISSEEIDQALQILDQSLSAVLVQ